VMKGRIVEVFLKDGKSFLGKLVDKDRDGVTVYGLYTRHLREAISFARTNSCDLADAVIRQLAFFPYHNIDYINLDDGKGHFASLYGHLFHPYTIEEFFQLEEGERTNDSESKA